MCAYPLPQTVGHFSHFKDVYECVYKRVQHLMISRNYFCCCEWAVVFSGILFLSSVPQDFQCIYDVSRLRYQPTLRLLVTSIYAKDDL